MSDGANKILKVVFAVLVIALLSELVYLFYSSTKKPVLDAVNVVPQVTITAENKVITTPVPPPVTSADQAINNQTLGFLALYKTGVLTSSILRNHYEGTITEIKQSPESPEGKRYALQLTLSGDNGDINSFYFTQAEVDSMTIIKNDPDRGEEKIKPADLFTGDIVTIEESLDLLNYLTSPSKEIRITLR